MICICGHRHRGKVECPACNCGHLEEWEIAQRGEENMIKKLWRKIKDWLGIL